MDSLTQIALGAALGEAVLGRQVGRRAALWGAICGTLPDLDVVVPFADAVADFTYHRSASHSLLVMAAVTPLLVWVIRRIHPQATAPPWRWAILVYLVFATHALLDSFTVYGTQIFWPLDTTPVALASVFIIDPMYTLPLIVGVTCALWLRHSRHGRRLNAVGLLLSSLYLAWGLGLRYHVENLAARSLTAQGIAYERLLAIPAPFNSALWRVLAVSDAHYHVAYYSLFDGHQALRAQRIESAPELIEPLRGSWAVERLLWFTRGFYSVEREGDDVVISDLRMGIEPDYVFRFRVGRIGNPHPHPLAISERIVKPRDFSRLPLVWQRIWDSRIDLTP